jgi:hypothetical protein
MLIKKTGILLYKKLNNIKLINLNLFFLKKYFKVKNLYDANADNKLVRYIKIKNPIIT